jgi:hypothetical protein
MSELFYLEMNGIPKADIYMLPRDAIMQNEEKEKVGYLIGQDWAYYRQPLPDNADAAIYRGYESNVAQIPMRSEVDRFTKKWLQLRYHAYLRKRTVSEDVTPGLIKAIDVSFCQVTKINLTHGFQIDSDWSVERLCNSAGYAWGNLTIISKKANEIRGSMTYDEICNAAESKKNSSHGLSPTEWERYKCLARGPNFWAGKTKGIEPICIPMSVLVFMSPSQLLQDRAFWSVRSKNPKTRESVKKFIKTLCPTETSKAKLTKLLHRIERHGEKGHLMKQTFTNKSCHEELKEWYESTNLTVERYTQIMTRALKQNLDLPKNSENPINPIEEWWLNTNGHFY